VKVMRVWCCAMGSPYMLCATVTAVALLAVSGCSRVVTGSATRDTHAPRPKPNGCEDVSAPLTAIDSRAASEPQLKIPQPTGWEQAATPVSDVIRFTMRNKDLSDNNFLPTAVVTLESVPESSGDNQAIFDQERAALVDGLGATGLSTTGTTRCGDEAELVDYDAPSMGQIPSRKARTLMVAGTFHDNTYVSTVTFQSTDPGNSIYLRDADTVLTGFQMLPPAVA
jgi:hypothetical protein